MQVILKFRFRKQFKPNKAGLDFGATLNMSAGHISGSS